MFPIKEPSRGTPVYVLTEHGEYFGKFVALTEKTVTIVAENPVFSGTDFEIDREIVHGFGRVLDSDFKVFCLKTGFQRRIRFLESQKIESGEAEEAIKRGGNRPPGGNVIPIRGPIKMPGKGN